MSLAWIVETVDDTGNVSPGSLALDSADRPHLSYEAEAELRYAHFDGATWVTEVDVF